MTTYIKYPDLLLLVGQLRHRQLVGEAAIDVYDSLIRQPVEIVEPVEGGVRAIYDLDRAVAVADGVFVPRYDVGLGPGQREEQLLQGLGHIELQGVLAAHDR